MNARGARASTAAARFLMPGMTEAHTHFSWNDQPSLSAIQFMPPEEHILWCVRVAKRYLEMGWTSALGAAAAKPRLDVVLRNAINAGEFPGPALSRRQPGNHDPRRPRRQHAAAHAVPELNFGEVVSGPEEMRATARMFIKYGVDHLKINLSGEYIAGIPAETSPFSEEEIAMLAAEAKRAGKRVAAHARSSESVKQCVRHGLELVFHASFADEEALDMLEANKDKHFVAPGIGWLISTLYHAEKWGITRSGRDEDGLQARTRNCVAKRCSKMHKRGIRILPGGDYGFAWMPHGTNARDLEYFVEVHRHDAEGSAAVGDQARRRTDDAAGRTRADSRRLSGRHPAGRRRSAERPAVLQDPEKISLVMKDGEIFKTSHDVVPPRGEVHASATLPVDGGVAQTIHAPVH